MTQQQARALGLRARCPHCESVEPGVFAEAIQLHRCEVILPAGRVILAGEDAVDLGETIDDNHEHMLIGLFWDCCDHRVDPTTEAFLAREMGMELMDATWKERAP